VRRLPLYFFARPAHGERRRTDDDEESPVSVIEAVVVTQREGTMNSVITVKCSALGRTVVLLMAAVLSGMFVAALLLSQEHHHDPFKVAKIICYLAVIHIYVINSFRFVVRLDDKEFHRRGLVRARTLSLDKVRSIRVSEERMLLGLIPYLKIEIQGEEGRILVAWRKEKLEPLLEALRRRFPEKVDVVERLPDL